MPVGGQCLCASMMDWFIIQGVLVTATVKTNSLFLKCKFFFFFLKQCLVITLILYNCFCKTLDLILIAFKITLGGVKKTHLTPHTLNVIG